MNVTYNKAETCTLNICNIVFHAVPQHVACSYKIAYDYLYVHTKINKLEEYVSVLFSPKSDFTSKFFKFNTSSCSLSFKSMWPHKMIKCNVGVLGSSILVNLR